MKKVLIAVIAGILALNVIGVSYAESYDDFNRRLGNSSWATPTHIGGGAVVAGLTTHYLPKSWKPINRWLVGVAAGVAAGCVSESLDKNWDNRDLIQWGMGGVIGATIFTMEF